jgi:hypothetical protein
MENSINAEDFFTNAESEIMIDIYQNVTNTEDLNASKIAESVKSSVNNPKFQRVLRILLENNVIEHISTIGSSKILQVNFSKLRDIIDSTRVVRKINSYNIDAHHGVILRA